MNEIINFGDGKTVKVTMLKGEAGNDIQSLEKTSTSGVVDTYTITLTDGTTHTFTVTNGSSIQSIAKTGTSGLVDTYTVTLTNGNTTTFEVTNGRSITNIALTNTKGLVDTYTITYNDNTTSTFTVTNGGGNVDNAFKVMGYNGAKNRLPYPYENTTVAINGLTFIDNGDGSITINGTSTDIVRYYLYGNSGTSGLKTNLFKGMLITCDYGYDNWSNSDIYIFAQPYTSDYSSHLNLSDSDGTGFGIPNNNMDLIRVAMYIYPNKTFDNVTIKPMARWNEDTDSTYQPYALTNQELTDISNIHYVNETNTDLDNYTKQGIYYFSSTYTPTNIPEGVNGWLLVIPSGANIKQIWMRHGSTSNTKNTFIRTGFGTTFSNWARFITSEEVYNDIAVGILEIPNITIGANSYANSEVTLTDFINAGVIPVALGGYNMVSESAQYLNAYRMELDKSGSTFLLGYGIHNNSSSSITITLKVKIMYLRSHSVTWDRTITG